MADEPEGAVRHLGVFGYAGTDDGYVPAHKTFKPVSRPTELKVEHFLKNNRFSGLSQREKKAASDAREPKGPPAAPPRSPATTTTMEKRQTLEVTVA